MKQALIYNELVRFYNRSRRKLQSLVLEGKNLRKQNILQRRIARLFKTLTYLQRALKLGLATTALSAGMLLFQPNAAQAQTSFGAVQTNPFGLTSIGNFSKPVLVDLDGDGDMDLISGELSGNVIYFQNIGNAGAPLFAAAQTNLFGLTDIDNHPAPAFADLDRDGDMDLLAGISYGFYGSFFYFQNTGTAAVPAFAAPQADPFGLWNFNFYHLFSTPAFADLDGDGDIDVMSGNFGGQFFYFQNTGIATDPAFAKGKQNQFGTTDNSRYSTPAFADLDGDGDMDMMSGEYYGGFLYHENTGTAAAPAFAAALTNPFGLTNIGDYSAPAFADLDNDGDMDLMAGESSGNFFYFENTTPCSGLTVYADADADIYGDAGNSLFVADCIVPGGYVFDNTDCDDSNASIHPFACDASNDNSIDDNCNGIVDDGSGATIYYTDADGDSYGAGTGTSLCSNPGAGYSTNNTDCNDANASSHPAANEVINGIDDNCDGTVDNYSWTQKADFGGTGRKRAVGFSIGSKGYLGTGIFYDGTSTYYKDFWEYDPDADTWTQKADFGGTAREFAVGFSIGSKGYIGTGMGNGFEKDFWQYDPAANTWTQKSDFGGTARYGAVGFSIGNKGYIGTGGTITYYKDFWQYDPDLNTWTQKADFGGIGRYVAVGFSIGSKGYIGTGYPSGNDFWEYDPDTNTWTRKADFGGAARSSAVGFSIDSKGYIGTGSAVGGPNKDFWEYDPDANIWTPKADFAGAGRDEAVGFSIGSKGYIGTGFDSSHKSDFWEYSLECIGLTVYADADGDNYGDVSNSYFVADCIVPSGYAYFSSDCDDSNASINPGVTEVANGIDDNCNGIIDDGVCLLPANLSVTKILGTSAKLKWNAVAEAEGYTVRYKVSNTNGWKYGTTYNNSKPISGLLPNTVYKWEVRTFCQVAPDVLSDWSSRQKFTTGSLRMNDEVLQQVSFQIYPNPAEDHSTIQFSIGVPSDTLLQPSHVYIKVYDVSGKEITTLLDADMEQGDHSLLLNTNHFPKGVYLVKMISEFGIENEKLIVQ